MTKRARVPAILLPVLMLLGATVPACAEGLDGATLPLIWALPFVGMLLSIALMPLFAGHFWEHHQGKIAAFWSACVVLPLLALTGFGVAGPALLHTALLDYVPFILMLLALFTVSGGIVVSGNIHGSPVANTVLLAIGTVFASLIGTTGASMVLIRPLIRANDNRRHNVHVVVFFIFLVSNLGGSLTPLGDPPLFLGFLRGVDFFWTTTHLFHETVFAAVVLLALFFVIDRHFYLKEGIARPDPTPDSPVRLRGGINMALILVIIAAILMSALVDFGGMHLAGFEIKWANVLRDVILLGVTVASVRLTPTPDREANGFTWGPIVEVAKLFAGIFACLIPVMAMLQAGRDGAFAPLVALVTHADGTPNNAAYFWASGALSSFLDNAPTYLVFFQMAGAGLPASEMAHVLMTQGAMTLAAISLGAVYMGANTYIGNAPNFMVYAIARERGVAMPSFFGYMVWSGLILLPLFVVVTLIFFE
jgi:Na+/H+ antiporter NhaD/arsenite permease-like protein